MGRAFRGTQLGYIGSRIAVSVRRYNLAMVQHRSKNWKMKDDEMILIAQLLLESRTDAYLKQLANEVIMTIKTFNIIMKLEVTFNREIFNTLGNF